MKIFQINIVYAEKSTGRTCKEVEKALLQQGYEVITAFGKGKNITKNSYLIDTPIEYYVHNILSRITGLQGYYSYFATKRLIKKIENFNPDVIHLRNLHANYLNLPLLFKYLAKINKPVIQNLHDCWVYTGKCPYYTDIKCDNWKTVCHDCPFLNRYPKSYFFDFTKKMYLDKKKWYSNINNLTIIGVSDWVTNEGKKSFLNRENVNFKRIYNWIDLSIFKKYNNGETKKQYGIDDNKFIILGVSANWSEGTVRYEDFMNLADMIDGNKMQIVLIGKSKNKIEHKNIIHYQYMDNTTELAKMYSMADVYVHMSVEDTFGKVIAEALACETPAIVYNSTGCSEIVGNGCGFVVEPRNLKEIINSINKIYNNEVKLTNMRKWVEDKFNYEKNVNELINLYKDLANTNEGKK